MDGGEEVVFASRKHIVVERHAGSDQLGYAALDEFFGQLGVFELLAYGHTFTGPYELGQVAVEGMVRKSGKFYVLCRAVGTPGEGNAEDFRRLNGIIAECLVEVADPEEQYSVGMLCLHLGVLLHKRCFDNLFGHIRGWCLRIRLLSRGYRY